MKNESGFTLIEVIVTLILVGIMASVAGFGIVTAVKGYLFAKNNTVVASKAQVALARMTRELTDLRSIPNPSANASPTAGFVVFDKIFETVAIGRNGTEIKIAKGNVGTTPDYTNGDRLMDQVTTGGLSFAYKKGAADWTSADDITELSHIVITLTMSGVGEGSNYTFNTTVNPRNNGNAGGTPPPTPASPPPIAAGQCFVATAAYGNPYDPMVILLKQFRDQYLVTWPGGRALIQFYYKNGPYLSEMIRDRPWASGAARLLLLPFVGFAFLLVYAKGSIPFVLLIIIAATWLVYRYPMRSAFLKRVMATRNEKGSVLIGLIVTMVVMAFLGVAMVSLTSTSSFNQVYGTISQKAYYLAESGFRYAGSEFLNITDSENNGKNENQNAMASNLNGRNLALAEGSIHLNVTPFHYATSAAAVAGATSLSVQFSGGTPSNFAVPSTGSIQIQTQYRPNSSTAYTTYVNTYSYTAFSGSTFTLQSPGLARAVPAWASVTVLAFPSSAQNNIIPNPDPTLTTNRLTLVKPSGGFFMPERNGKFKIQGNPVTYKYDYRVDGTSTTTLYGVCNSLTPASATPFSVTTASQIIPNDFFRIASTGTTGSVSRTLNYITPVDITTASGTPASKTTYADPFTAGVQPGTTGSHWFASTLGTHSVLADVTGGAKTDGTTGAAALQLTSSYNYGGSSCGGNDMYFSLLAFKWDEAFANFYASWLGHDQTLSYDAQVKMRLPQQDYYMAGMMFRLNLGTTGNIEGASSLGVAFLRGSSGDEEGIEDTVVPVANVPLIVLWRKNSGTDLSGMQWIAYKILSGGITFNNGDNPFFANSNSFARGGTSGARARVGTVTTTDGGVSGMLGVSSPYSTFQAGEELFQYIRQTSVSAYVTTPISSGSIGYNYGSDSAIQVGDIIRGRTTNFSARVTSVTRNSYWGGYRGTITITESSGTFSSGERMDIYRPNVSHSAHFVSFNSPDDILTSGTEHIKDWSSLMVRIEEKLDGGQYVNDIKIYRGDTDTHGTPTGSPLDALRYNNKRWSNPPATGDVQWPPDAGWSSDLAGNVSKDHFTLVQGWSINPALTSAFSLTGTAEEPNSTIRTNTFTTHGLSNFTQQEIGLQTAAGGMDTYTYFDDFAIQLEGGVTGGESGFTTPLQY